MPNRTDPNAREWRWNPGESADVEQLDPTVASLPPLLHLTELRLERLYYTEKAISQFLNQCPALCGLKLRSVDMHLPYNIKLSGHRTVYINHNW